MSVKLTASSCLAPLTLRGRARRACHLCLLQALIVIEQLRARFRAAADQRFGVLARLANLHDVFELLLADLRRGQNKLSPPSDGLGLLELLDLGVTGCNELRLVGSLATLAVLALPLPALGFLVFWLALVL